MREGEPVKGPPSCSPLLAVGGSADNKIWEQLKKHHPKGGVFLLIWPSPPCQEDTK